MVLAHLAIRVIQIIVQCQTPRRISNAFLLYHSLPVTHGYINHLTLVPIIVNQFRHRRAPSQDPTVVR